MKTTAPANPADETPVKAPSAVSQPNIDGVLKDFVDGVVSLTKSEREGVERFAKEYLPAFLQYTVMAKSDDVDVKTRGERMLGHIRAQVALRAGIYGVKLEQSMLAALFGLFSAAIDKIPVV